MTPVGEKLAREAFSSNRQLPLSLQSILTISLLISIVTAPAVQKNPSIKRTKPDPSAEFFADHKVRLVEIELTEPAKAALRSNPRSYIIGNVREGTQTFTKVGIHLKGMGSFRRLDEKPSFVLNFDKFLPDQEYCGLTKLMLNNSVQDQTYLAELLATSLFRDAGVPAARVTHVRVKLDGKDLGLYTAIEAMNKRFLKRNFKNNNGNLYEGYLRDINTRMDQDNGEDTSQSDVRALLAACRIPEVTQRFERLNRVLDVERFAAFAAVEMLIAHWDGYTLHTNNYRFYHDPASDKMVFIAHGLDAVFIRPNVSVQPPMRSTVSRALFQTSEGRHIYEQRLRELYTNVFRLEVISNRMEQAMTKLRDAQLPATQLADIEKKAAKMFNRIEHRSARVRDQLAGVPLKPLQFDADSLAYISEWREEFDRGEPAFSRSQDGGKTALRIQAQGGRCRSSWRSMIYLKAGRYRFEGQVRTAGISGGGAGLRISGATRNMRIAGENPWRALQHEFIVEEEEGGDIELVCEFDAVSGDAWYDLGSLRVRRLGP